MKRRNNSQRASALQITLAAALIATSAILLGFAAPTNTRKVSRQVTAPREPSGATAPAIVTPAAPTPTPMPCGRIAFENAGFIYVMNADGTGQHVVGSGYNPSFSADGSKIAFVVPGSGIFIMDDNGGNITQLTGGPDDEPSLNGDGSKLVFSHNYNTNSSAIYVMNTTPGSAQTQLTSTGLFLVGQPSFSADGSKIAFVQETSGPESQQIYVMNANGSGQHPVTSGNQHNFPSFNGDGSRIAYRDISADETKYDIYVMNADGSGQTQLTTNGHIREPPSFSPDGTRIAFQQYDGNANNIYVMDASGGNQHQLTSFGANNPSFSGCPPFVIGLEVTQGVQDLNNSVPLVEHKKTFVRAHVKNPTSSAGPFTTSASLTAKNSATGAILGTITNSNAGGQITVPRFPVRAGLNSSFLFEVPPAWRTGTVEFSLAGNGLPIGCVTGGDACSKATVTFRPVAPLNMKFVFLTWRSGGVDHATTLADLPQVVGEYLGRYPINLVDTFTGTERVTVDPCTQSNIERILRSLNNLRNSDCSSGPCQDFYQGLLADQNACSPRAELNGEADDIPGHVSAAFIKEINTDDTTTRLHEQGHVMGLKHTDYNSSRGLLPKEECENLFHFSTPCTMLELDGTLSSNKDQYGPDTVYGCDINGSSPQKIYPPETTDFMSYGYPRWPSRVNYELLFNKFVLPVAPLAPEKLNQNQMSASQTVIIDGSVQFNGPTGQLGSVFVKTTQVNVTLPSPGDYSIRLEDSQGAELARFAFDPLRGSGETDFSTGAISLLLPWDPSAKRIVLLHNEDVLDSREASANSPTVNVTFPNGGEVLTSPSATFTWIAGDSDGDALTYALEYSPDNGATWETLAIDWNAQSLPVDLTKLHGSNQALVRVTACDGFNCAHAQSQGTFTVPDHAPTAGIASPENNQLYVGDQTIILEGAGFDIEDGALGDSSLSWTSDLNGPLGTGSSLVIDAMALQEGTHTITLTATDSTGHVGSASIPIRVFRIFAVSRKTHGDAGDFDVDLPLTGTPGIECRSGGATSDHTIIVTFSSPVTVTGNPQAQVTSGTATVGSGGTDNGGLATVSGNVVTIPLTNVPNGQTITVTLQGVNDGTNTNNVSVPMGVLAGDTTANGFVNSSDIAQTQSQSGQSVTASNFREDVTVNGLINSSDISFVQSKSGTGVSSTQSNQKPSLKVGRVRRR